VEVRDLEARIDVADPRHATFVSSRPLDADGIRALLDEDTLLLEIRWAKRAATSGSCRGARCGHLRWPHERRSKRSRRVHTSLARSPAKTSKAADGVTPADARALTRMVIRPAASLLTGKRLVVSFRVRSR
jgi:hypothetical protein